MYLKKMEGPRAVALPDGRILTRADLPAAGTRRWVASRKEAVVLAVNMGLVGREEALRRWNLSAEELDEWQNALAHFGPEALKTTRLMTFRSQ